MGEWNDTCFFFAALYVRSVPRVGPSLQKPFSQYLEAQRSKLHHAGESGPAVSTSFFMCACVSCNISSLWHLWILTLVWVDVYQLKQLSRLSGLPSFNTPPKAFFDLITVTWHHLVFLGWQLAVVGVWEGGAGDGLLLCHFYRQLHGSELRQAAAAAEALRGENQVMRRRRSWTGVQWTVSAAAELWAQPQSLKTNLTPHHPQQLNMQRFRQRFVCVCVQGMSVSRFCSSSCHLSL